MTSLTYCRFIFLIKIYENHSYVRCNVILYIFYFVLALFIILLAVTPEGSFEIISAILFRDSITLLPFAFVGSIMSFTACIILFLSILFAFEMVDAIRSISCC
jgi:hypothetical protein